ncbi:protein-export chaperone SecB [Acetobacter ascendens]|uniref:protein-export chaperone SecB n=1 Tax=Acetobacter ascendens TaxID=481146 RepID=UPI000875C302|nr:protein-export chaperone SecB [Acetobacter ascendens]AOW49087.1 preprotein translocase subunit SecB [Acetobacter ascendens]
MNTETADSLSGASHTSPAPSVLMGIQYVKSVEFQVLGAPAIYSRVTERPHLGVSVDVRAHQMGENQPNFEVELILRCQGHLPAQREGEEIVPLFDVNLIYAGIFTLQHATAETFELLLLIEAPRLLYPAARNMLGTLCREAGFLPVIMQQIDFAALWRNRRAVG